MLSTPNFFHFVQTLFTPNFASPFLEWRSNLSGERGLLPRPEYLVALKLHAAASPTRSKPGVDWEDIRQLVRICALDPSGDESFRALILRYGGEDALAKIQAFIREP